MSFAWTELGVAALALTFSAGLLMVGKWGFGQFRERRAQRGVRRPKRFDFNLIVIGGGSGGLVTAYVASAVKAKVALVEKGAMGGDCLNTGCVPSKALIRTGKILRYVERSDAFGIPSASAEFDFQDVMARVRRVIGRIEPHDSAERYASLGVEVLKGEARLRSPFEVEVRRAGETRTLTARSIVVATGAEPWLPPIEGLEDVPHSTSESVWQLEQLPRRLLVVGGGPIGCELGQCFARLGSRVCIVEAGRQLLPREDLDVANSLRKRLAEEGVEIRTGQRVVAFQSQPEPRARCESAEGPREVGFDHVLLALGRRARTKGFGLEELGVRLDERGNVACDDRMRTSVRGVYACGDVAGPYQFTHVAAHQAWFAAVNALFAPLKSFRVDYRVLPQVTYTDPEVARVGLSLKEAREQGLEFEETRYGLDDLDRAIADEAAEGMVRVLTKRGSDQILGATIVGAHAGELLAEFVLAMKYRLGLKKILATVHAYPTLAEANRYAAGVWAKAHAPQRLLRWVRRFHDMRR